MDRVSARGKLERLERIARRVAHAYGPALAVSVVLGAICVLRIEHDAGGPAAPLDDAFIHLNYAKNLAAGRFFQYVPGEGYSSGATSFAWPILLAPFYALGLRDVALLRAAWLFGTIAHAGVAVEAGRLTRRLAGNAAAIGVGAMCLLFGAFAWFAWSGMETMALAWLLLRSARAAAAFCDPEADRVPSVRELVVLGIVTPLVRPEGAIASLIVAIALVYGRARRPLVPRFVAFAPLAGPLLVPLINLLLTGHATSTTAQVKWLVESPYFTGASFVATFVQNARMLVGNLMDGGPYTVVFLPERSSVPILLGAIALPIAASRRNAPFHALFVALVALGSFVPCTYSSFLWNRIRYVWPFAGAWFVLVGCMCREAGDLARLVRPRLTAVTPLLAGAAAGALGVRLPWAIHDLAQSASAITRQQVKLGRWAAEHLPADARIGVNDTGAIAYLSNRRTFDVVGLTTQSEARYWAAGAGSRFEHYERMSRARRPTHFIVYPDWMACSAVLGDEIAEATVVDQSILGGNTMIAYAARWDLLGSGALPAEPPANFVLSDELDVADLESEAAHAYQLGEASEQDNQVATVEGEHVIVDGGRLNRTEDRFQIKLPPHKSGRLVMRVSADAPIELVVSAADREIAVIPVAVHTDWIEPSIVLPAYLDGGELGVSVTARSLNPRGPGRFGVYHYWAYADR